MKYRKMEGFIMGLKEIKGDYQGVKEKICQLYRTEDVCFQELFGQLILPDLSFKEQVRLYADLSDELDGDTVIRITEGCPYMVDEYENLCTGEMMSCE